MMLSADVKVTVLYSPWRCIMIKAVVLHASLRSERWLPAGQYCCIRILLAGGLDMMEESTSFPQSEQKGEVYTFLDCTVLEESIR